MPYSQIDASTMILRDHLAYDRTVLAVERTFLAYIRTAIGLFATGGTAIVLVENVFFQSLGGLAVLAGIACTVFGIRQYRRALARLNTLFIPLSITPAVTPPPVTPSTPPSD